MPKPLLIFLNILSNVMTVCSPFVFNWALSKHTIDTACLLVLIWIFLRSIPKFLTVFQKPASERRALLSLPLLALLFALLGFLFRNQTFLLLLPSLTQLGFALVFLRSLRPNETPLAEHFARTSYEAKRKPFPISHQSYCRNVTKIWSTYLLFLSGVGVILAFFSPLEVWTFYSGIGSYLLIGLLLGGEFLFRTLKFRNEV